MTKKQQQKQRSANQRNVGLDSDFKQKVKKLENELSLKQDEARKLTAKVKNLESLTESDKERLEDLNRQLSAERAMNKDPELNQCLFCKEKKQLNNTSTSKETRLVEECDSSTSSSSSSSSSDSSEDEDSLKSSIYSSPLKKVTQQRISNEKHHSPKEDEPVPVSPLFDESTTSIDDEANWQVKSMELQSKIPHFVLYESNPRTEKVGFFIRKSNVKTMTKMPVFLGTCSFQLEVDESEDIASFIRNNRCSNISEDDEIVCISTSVVAPASKALCDGIVERLERRLASRPILLDGQSALDLWRKKDHV